MSAASTVVSRLVALLERGGVACARWHRELSRKTA